MYIKLKRDWFLFNSNRRNKSFLSKLIWINNNPGMKMVLMNRLINETPNYLFLLKKILRLYYHHLMYKYGIDLPLSLNFGENLRIMHFGGVIIHSMAKIGNNVIILHGVTIGGRSESESCPGYPNISNNVQIGTGAVIIGGITIAEKVKIGANSVVTKSFYEPNISIGGIPAKKLISRIVGE